MMKNIDYAKIMKEHYEEIIDKMKEMDAESRPYQMDLYIYPDGSLYDYVNVGGNSHLNDEHFVICKIDNQNNDRDEMSPEEILEACENRKDEYFDMLDSAIAEAEEAYKEYKEYRAQ